MSISMKPIEEASAYELRAFATNFLNLEMTGSESDVEVKALIQRAQPEAKTIFVNSEEADEAMPLGQTTTISSDDAYAGERQAGSLGKQDPRVIINSPVGSGDDVLSRSDVAVGVNGVVWQIKRGVDVDVPLRVVEALGLTEQDIVRHNFEDDSVIVTKAMRFPINFPKGKPSDEVMKAWHDRVDDLVMP